VLLTAQLYSWFVLLD